MRIFRVPPRPLSQLTREITAYAPHTAWVQVAHLLQTFVQDLDTPARMNLVDSLAQIFTRYDQPQLADQLGSTATEIQNKRAWSQETDNESRRKHVQRTPAEVDESSGRRLCRIRPIPPREKHRGSGEKVTNEQRSPAITETLARSVRS